MGWIHAHRVLLVVYGAGLLLAVFETRLPYSLIQGEDRPEWFLDPERNIADVSAAVHPERASTHYYRAYQASLCQGRREARGDVCDRRGPVAPGEIRELIERSLATGNESIELVLYNYVLVLLQTRASPEEVDAAVRAWRVAHPHSARPDPRDAFRRR